MEIEKLICGFGRPEYPKNPEGLQSALAWRMARINEENFTVNGNNGLVYETIIETTSQYIDPKQTRPISERKTEFIGYMEQAGFSAGDEMSNTSFCDGLLDTLSGVIPPKAKAKAAVPMTVSMAYLQDAIGLHAKEGPPNFGEIIEQLFDAGRRESEVTSGASNLWIDAIKHGSKSILNKNLESLFSSWLADEHAVGPFDIDEKAYSGPNKHSPCWIRCLDTPFSWFNDTWKVLCQPEWINSLPMQRWSDWASCVLRTSIGMGFLWEAELYCRIGRYCLNSDFDRSGVAQELKKPFELIRWRPQGLPLTVLDQNSPIIRTIIDGVEVRTFFSKVLDDPPANIKARIAHSDQHESLEGFLDLIEHVREGFDEGSKSDLSQCFGGPKRGAAKNTIETVTYLLQCRQSAGRGADFYSLLTRKSRRFLVVDPGEEWIVVLASLATKSPRGRTVLGSIRESLRSLGLTVDRETLVLQLERAGMTRSSHDADDAIEVWSGF